MWINILYPKLCLGFWNAVASYQDLWFSFQVVPYHDPKLPDFYQIKMEKLRNLSMKSYQWPPIIRQENVSFLPYIYNIIDYLQLQLSFKLSCSTSYVCLCLSFFQNQHSVQWKNIHFKVHLLLENSFILKLFLGGKFFCFSKSYLNMDTTVEYYHKWKFCGTMS